MPPAKPEKASETVERLSSCRALLATWKKISSALGTIEIFLAFRGSGLRLSAAAKANGHVIPFVVGTR